MAAKSPEFTPEESMTEENIQMTQKPGRIFTPEQKAEAVSLVTQSGKRVTVFTTRHQNTPRRATRRMREKPQVRSS
ncbi:MAG: hypothetical protein WCA07_09065 [Gloeobacterales cyanobacterium]